MSTPASEIAGGPLGFFGGTFDPVHFGHLRLAEEAADALGLATIVWSPAGQPPHRDPPRVAAADRLAMVELATAGNPRFRVDANEATSAAPSYTVTALERLRRQFGPARPLVLLLGSDAFAGLCTWHRWPELFGLAHLAVTHRPGVELDAGTLPAALAAEFASRRTASPATLAESPAGRIVGFAMTPLAISATQIRGLLTARQSARYLLPAAVVEYIESHRLYHTNPSA